MLVNSMKIKKWLTNVLENLFGIDRFSFEKVIIEKAVMDDIIEFAKSNYPKEFVALLGGRIRNKKLFVDKIIYQHYFSSHVSAMMKMNLPILSDVVGSVHSHNGYNNIPSRADMNFFSKSGFFHIIIAYPFTIQTIAAYNVNGKRIEFSI